MAFLINNTSVIQGGGQYPLENRLQNLASTNPVLPSIFDLSGWNAGTMYSRGGSGSWSSGTENLRTRSVQPTTNDFSEAVLRLNCDLISSGDQDWQGFVTLKFQGASNAAIFTLVAFGEPVSIGSSIYVHIISSRFESSTLTQYRCESFLTQESGGNATEVLKPYANFSIQGFDFTSHDLEISWPSATTTTMSWNAQMFWK